MYCIDKLTSKNLDKKVIWRIKAMYVLKTSQSDICRVTSLGEVHTTQTYFSPNMVQDNSTKIGP